MFAKYQKNAYDDNCHVYLLYIPNQIVQTPQKKPILLLFQIIYTTNNMYSTSLQSILISCVVYLKYRDIDCMTRISLDK